MQINSITVEKAKVPCGSCVVRGLTAILVIVLLTGCRPPKSATTPVLSVGEPAATWPTSTLAVCFEAGPNSFTQEEKNLIRAIIKSEFTPSATLISFTGWKDCSVAKDPQVKLIKAEQASTASFAMSRVFNKITGERSGVGIGHSKKVKGEDGKFYYIPLTSDEYAVAEVTLAIGAYCKLPRLKIGHKECFQGLALHEFGHVAGLRHEHIRPEALKDPLCLKSKNAGVTSGKREEAGPTAVLFGAAYDPRSIMNYCYMDAYENGIIPLEKIALSQGDLLTIKKLYKK